MSMAENTRKFSAIQKHVETKLTHEGVKLTPEKIFKGKIHIPLISTDNTYPKIESKEQSSHISSQNITKRDKASIHEIEEQCRQFCLATFFRRQEAVRSLGITSSVAGEGKSLLSIVMAQVLTDISTAQIILLECNWEHRSLHEYFNLPQAPGLAEWQHGECSEEDIRHKVSHNLTVILAGDSKREAVKLLQQIRQQGLLNMFAQAGDLVIVDLPPIVTTAYGVFAASLVEALAIVVRAGVTPAPLVTKVCSQLKDLPIEGLILNQAQSKTPQWIQRIV